ncbi:MAG: hypothetical protein J7L15_04465 [Clostridiales bacterium]|nr:hypothetical protein [Clostridiales bacterium]
MFKELFEKENEMVKVFVGFHEQPTGVLSIIDAETGEVNDFKNIKELMKTIEKTPRDYDAFFRKSSKEIRQEASDEKMGHSVEVAVLRIPYSDAKAMHLTKEK